MCREDDAVDKDWPTWGGSRAWRDKARSNDGKSATIQGKHNCEMAIGFLT